MSAPTIAACIVLAALSLGAAAAQDCSEKDWKACKGKPWVIGTTMDTPIGDRWWPNTLWGKDDQAGSTNWYTKPEVVQRTLAEAKTGKVYRNAALDRQAMKGFMFMPGDGVFFYVFSPVPFTGATGSPGAPLAIR